jgi:hypothetical protein
MKIEKQRLTKIITTVKERFPEGEDIFGFSGVNRQKIVQSLNNSYSLLGLIEAYEDEIETIWLKRRLARYFDDLFSLLKETESEKWLEKFDIFLTTIAKLRIAIKDLYITLSDNPLRNEIMLQDSKDRYEELNRICQGLDESITIIKSGSMKAIDLEKTLEDLKVELASSTDKAREVLNSLKEYEIVAHEASDTINDIAPKLASTYGEAREVQKSLVLNEEKTTKLIAMLDDQVVNSGKMQNELDEQMISNSRLQSQIQQTLQDVNKHGMAGAFLKRKKELQTSVAIWGTLSVIAMGILIFVSYNFAIKIIDSSSFDLAKNLFKIPSVIAGVWLCWFCAKQFGYTIRIREDYSFKYAISMAFEGYKNETREINADLLAKLLEVTVANISSNPVLMYNTKTNHGSPMQEMAAAIKNFMKIEVKADVTANTSDLSKL